jgi:hypothetical protein
MASKSEKPILHSLLKLLQKICLYAKFMLMISYLGLLTNLLVKSLELKYFLGFQVKQLHDDTFIIQTKYIQDILNKFGRKDAKPIMTPSSSKQSTIYLS